MQDYEICNLSLNFLGKGSITSLDDKSELARTCKLHYERYRRMLLSEFSWPFAARTVKLTALDTDELADYVIGWNNLYEYPDDCLKILRVYDEGLAAKKLDSRKDFYIQSTPKWEYGTKVICCNIEDAYADYVADVEDPDYFPDEFIETLAHYLAYGMAQALTGSESKAQTELQYAQQALYQAKLFTERERERKPSTPHKYFDARS